MNELLPYILCSSVFLAPAFLYMIRRGIKEGRKEQRTNVAVGWGHLIRGWLNMADWSERTKDDELKGREN